MFAAVTAPDYLDAIKHLPPGTSLHADNVSWEVYDRLMDALADFNAVRIYYDQGRLEAMSPSGMHEKPSKILHRLANVLSDELEIDVEAYGQTTLRRQLKAKGAEPDESFYIQHAAQIIGREDLNIDLAKDPPPDLVLESDVTSSSLNRFAIYAALGVPEIWQIVEQQVSFWVLADGSYQEASSSLAFPFLSAQKLNSFLRTGISYGERKAAHAMRQWLQKQNLLPDKTDKPDAQ